MASNQPTSPLVTEPVPRSTSEGAAKLGEIVVFTDNRREASSILEFAGQLAEEHGARLISIFIQPSPVDTPHQTFARGIERGLAALLIEPRDGPVCLIAIEPAKACRDTEDAAHFLVDRSQGNFALLNRRH